MAQFSYMRKELFTGDLSRNYFERIFSKNARKQPLNDVRDIVFKTAEKLQQFDGRLYLSRSLDDVVKAREALDKEKIFNEVFTYTETRDEAGNLTQFEYVDGNEKVTIKMPEGMDPKQFPDYVRDTLKKNFFEQLQEASETLLPRMKQRGWGAYGSLWVAMARNYMLIPFILPFMFYITLAYGVIATVRNAADSNRIGEFKSLLKDNAPEIDKLKERLKSQEEAAAKSAEAKRSEDNSISAQESEEHNENTVLDETQSEDNNLDSERLVDEEASERRRLSREVDDRDNGQGEVWSQEVREARRLDREIMNLTAQISRLVLFIENSRKELGLPITDDFIERISNEIDSLLREKGVCPEGKDQLVHLNEIKNKMEELKSRLDNERRAYEMGALVAGNYSPVTPIERLDHEIQGVQKLLYSVANKKIPKSPAQNVNGNLYLGATQLILLAHTAKHRFSMPIYMTEDQMYNAGLKAPGKGVTVMMQKGDKVIGQKVYNIQETDFQKKYPEVFASIKDKCKEYEKARDKANAKKPEAKTVTEKALPTELHENAACRAAAAAVATAMTAQRNQESGGFVLDGTFQDVVRGLIESGGLSSDLFWKLDSASQRAIVRSVQDNLSPAYGVDFGGEIDAAVSKLDESKNKEVQEDISMGLQI